MKYIIYLVFGLIAVTLLAPSVKFENIKSSEASSAIPNSSVEAVESPKVEEAVNTPIVPEQAPVATAPVVSEPVKAPETCEEAIYRIFPANEHANAIKVMVQESSRNPAIHNYNPSTGDDSYGCFQINLAGNNKYSRPSPAELVIAENNVAFAYNLWKSTGWCSTGGWLNTSKKVGIC